MGLESGGGHKTYVKISNGRMAIRCEADTPGAIKCSNKDNTKTWYELRYPALSGFIGGVTTRQTEWGGKKLTDLCISINDGADFFELQMPLDSKYSKGFLRCMPNIDLSRKISFNPWMKEVSEGGKVVKKTALYLQYSKDEKIDWYWTKDNPLGLPDMVQTVFKGETVWDDTEQMKYLMAHLNDTFLPRLKATQFATAEPRDNFIDDLKELDGNPEENLPF